MKSLAMLWGLAVALSVGATLALAGEREELDILLNVHGTIEIGPEGEVHDLTLKTPLPPALAESIDRQIRQWRFEPVLVDGRPVIARTSMGMTLVAVPAGDGYDVGIQDMGFGSSIRPNERIMRRHSVPYPTLPGERGPNARVVVAIRIDDEGRVMDAHVYQVSLAAQVPDAAARRWRARFERAVMSKALKWRFEPDELSDERGMAGDFMMAIEWMVGPSPSFNPGRWRTYVPGPVSPAPWMDPSETRSFDAITAGTALALNPQVRLKEAQLDGAL